MPTSSEILAGATRIANDAFAIAVLWHLAIAVALAALALGWRPLNRTAALLLAAPVASAGALAWAAGNPFNGTVLAVLAATVVALGLRLRDRVSAGPAWTTLLGGLLVGFAWLYPHFLEGPASAYLYGSPVGLIPCPTLALVIGFTLLGGGLGGRSLSIVLAVAGAFYGIVGVAWLGVTLDVGLLLGAGGLFALLAPRLRTSVSP